MTAVLTVCAVVGSERSRFPLKQMLIRHLREAADASGAPIVGSWLARNRIDAYLSARFSDDPDLRRRVARLSAMEAS